MMIRRNIKRDFSLKKQREKLLREIQNVKNRLKDENIEKDLNTRFSYIDDEIETRVECIKNGLNVCREEFLRDIESMKQTYKMNLMNNHQFTTFRAKLDKFENTINYDQLMTMFSDSNKMLQKYLNELNQIKFNTNPVIEYGDLIGEIQMPFTLKIKTSKHVQLGNRAFNNFVYSEKRNQVFISDYIAGAIYAYNLADGSVQELKHKDMVNPTALCIGNGHLYVFDEAQASVLIFEGNFKLKSRYIILNDSVISMQTNTHGARSLVYFAHQGRDNVDVRYSENGRLFKQIDVKSPTSIAFDEKFIYVLEKYCDDELDHLRKVNSICLVDKVAYQIVDRIIFDSWRTQPHGLGFDENHNLLTIVFEDDVRSTKPRLYVINKDSKEIVNKIRIKEKIDWYLPVMFFKNKIAILYEQSMKMIELE